IKGLGLLKLRKLRKLRNEFEIVERLQRVLVGKLRHNDTKQRLKIEPESALRCRRANRRNCHACLLVRSPVGDSWDFRSATARKCATRTLLRRFRVPAGYRLALPLLSPGSAPPERAPFHPSPRR